MSSKKIINDVNEAKEIGCSGIIVGKAIYEEKISHDNRRADTREIRDRAPVRTDSRRCDRARQDVRDRYDWCVHVRFHAAVEQDRHRLRGAIWHRRQELDPGRR